MDIGVDEIRKWHKARGWSDVGYHFVIRRDGLIEVGRELSKTGAHVKGHNTGSIGICLVGGTEPDGQTPEANFEAVQMEALDRLLHHLTRQFDLSDADVYGHRDAPGVTKACPAFDVAHWIETGEVRS